MTLVHAIVFSYCYYYILLLLLLLVLKLCEVVLQGHVVMCSVT